jgi:hypothetical protein
MGVLEARLQGVKLLANLIFRYILGYAVFAGVLKAFFLPTPTPKRPGLWEIIMKDWMRKNPDFYQYLTLAIRQRPGGVIDNV